MTQDITEGNRLIAEFTGWTCHKSQDAGILGGSITYWRNPDTGSVGYFHPDKYHTSWDCLMPVLEKIGIWYDNDSDNYADSMEKENLTLFRQTIFEDIKYVYDAVIQFIQWYNKQTV